MLKLSFCELLFQNLSAKQLTFPLIIFESFKEKKKKKNKSLTAD